MTCIFDILLLGDCKLFKKVQWLWAGSIIQLNQEKKTHTKKMTSIHGQHGVGITNVFELSQVDLRFFSDTEIRKLSVCQVHEPRTYDQLMNPVSGGLYDPKMGPISEDVICVTCREMRGYCPGHMGHISLPFPVCSPRRFSDLMFFLNSSCPFCERLRIDTATVSSAHCV